MPRAVLKDGVIYPLDPLPSNWTNGKELWVDESPLTEEDLEEIDRQFRRLEAAAQHIDPEDVARVEAALREADQMAKELMRREMGLP